MEKRRNALHRKLQWMEMDGGGGEGERHGWCKYKYEKGNGFHWDENRLRAVSKIHQIESEERYVCSSQVPQLP